MGGLAAGASAALHRSAGRTTHEGCSAITVAAADSPAGLKDAAHFVCRGRNDLSTLQKALDLVPSSGGEVVMFPGTFSDDGKSTLSVGVTSTGEHRRTSLRFQSGARLVVRRTGEEAVIKIEGDDCYLEAPRLINAAPDRLGTGIALGGEAERLGGRLSAPVYRASVSRCIVRGFAVGVELATVDGQGSSGDCLLWAGQIVECDVGILNRSFANRWIGPTIAECSTGIWIEGPREETQLTCYGPTVLNWSKSAIRVDGGFGTSIHDAWLEQSHAHGGDELDAAIVVGEGGPPSAAYSLHFAQTTHVQLGGEAYVMRVAGARGLRVDELLVSTSGSSPRVAVIVNDLPSEDGDNVVGRVTFGPDRAPDFSLVKAVKSKTSKGRLIVERAPAGRNAPAFSTVPNRRAETSDRPIAVKREDETIGGTLAEDSDLTLWVREEEAFALTAFLRFTVVRNVPGQRLSLIGPQGSSMVGSVDVFREDSKGPHRSVMATSTPSAAGEVLTLSDVDSEGDLILSMRGSVTTGSAAGFVGVASTEGPSGIMSVLIRQGSWMRLD